MCKVNGELSENIFWDLGGQKLLRSIWKKYYSECHGLIFVIDSVDIEKLSDAKYCLNEILINEDL
jgi:ADP-ribosylation factor related protein 1